MLGGVATCQSCGARMSSNREVKPNGYVHHYYGCNGVNTGTCAHPSRIRRDDLDAAVESFVKLTLGPLPVMERARNSVSEVKVELAEAASILERLESDYLAGRVKTDVQVERYWGQHECQSKKVERLREEIEADEGAVSVGRAEDGSRRVLVAVPEAAGMTDGGGLHHPAGHQWPSPEVEFILPARRTHKWK
ncbi:zinc ribbon domain-containing protein [Streptomyces sp. NPDC058611]